MPNEKNVDLVEDNRAGITLLAQTQKWITPERQINNLSSPGNGNMNRVLRATMDDGSTVILKQALPYVAKYPDIAAPIERLESEVAFYRAAQTQAAVQIRIPVVIGFDHKHQILCLQDLGDIGDMSVLYNTIEGSGTTPSVGNVFSGLVYWLWKLHSIDVETIQQAALHNTKMRALNHAHIFDIPFQTNNGVELSSTLKKFSNKLIQDQQLVNAAKELGEIYLGQRTHDSKPCLLHGDFYPGSWFTHADMGAMVIDPEFCFIGPPEFDVGVMVGHLTLCGLEQPQIMTILQSYVPPTRFNYPLAMRFAAIEIIRRIIGVAQLPLVADDNKRIEWLEQAAALLNPSRSS